MLLLNYEMQLYAETDVLNKDVYYSTSDHGFLLSSENGGNCDFVHYISFNVNREFSRKPLLCGFFVFTALGIQFCNMQSNFNK